MCTALQCFQAQEDADVLRSVVLPLEEEISSLKFKLRDALGLNRSGDQQAGDQPIEGDATEVNVTDVCKYAK